MATNHPRYFPQLLAALLGNLSSGLLGLSLPHNWARSKGGNWLESAYWLAGASPKAACFRIMARLWCCFIRGSCLVPNLPGPSLELHFYAF